MLYRISAIKFGALWWENGRQIKALGRFPTKSAAWKAAKPLRES